jgi:hypothetical protein
VRLDSDGREGSRNFVFGHNMSEVHVCQTKEKPLRDLPKIPKELVEQFGEALMSAGAIEDASAAFKKALTERALRPPPGYPLGAQRPEDAPTSVTARVERRL